MPLQRRHAFIPAVIALVAVAAFAFAWIAARTEWARGIVARQVTDATGLPASVAALHVGFFPSPTLDIGGLAVAQPPGFAGKPILEAGHVVVRLPWGSIFGAARFDAVTVSDATARLIVAKDGATNWSKLFPQTPGTTEPAAPPAWFVRAFGLERGAVEYRDESAPFEWQLAAIFAQANDVAPAAEFPLDLRLAGLSGPNTIHYAVKGKARLDPGAGQYEASGLEFRGWAGGDPLPLAGVELTGALARAAYDGATGVATFGAGRFNVGGIPGSFEGSLDFDGPALAGSIKVATEPFAPRPPAVVFGHPLPTTTDPAAFESLQLALAAQLQDGVLRLDPVSGRLDDTNFEGLVVPNERLVRASLDQVDLNRYVPPAVKTAGSKKATLEAAVAELAAFDLDAVIKIEEARVAGARIRDAVIRVERNAAPGSAP